MNKEEIVNKLAEMDFWYDDDFGGQICFFCGCDRNEGWHEKDCIWAVANDMARTQKKA